ncbi:MAG: hypothetical protein RJA09_1644 [Pseudomonadota bacterium]|jgi:uncharacterized protein YigA (DUF484 family)
MNPIPPITEDDIVQFLVNSPGFFERHAELLASIQLTSPHGQRAVSLQERQAEMLRDKIRHLEHKAVDMIRHGQENVTIADRLQTWTCRLLAAREAQGLPALLVQGLESDFGVPQAAIRVWGVDEAHASEPYAAGVSEEARLFATSLGVPYCGPNPGLEAATWLADPAAAASMALVPLREATAAPAFGLLVLASPDAQRFQSSMGTDFLERIGELASAALLRLQAPEPVPAG